jgi:mono/diheme cytochrome c family protein
MSRNGIARKRTESTNGAIAVGKSVNRANSSRIIFTPALGALALVAALATGVGGLTSIAHAEEAKASTDLVTAGRELFNNWSCSACHTLSDAGAAGAVGPTLDNPGLTRDGIKERIEMGGGPMPSFAGQISEADIGKLADYIVAVNHKGAAVAAAPAPATSKQ